MINLRTIFTAIFLCNFSFFSVQAQKLKLSKERKVELDSIKKMQQEIWLEETTLAENRKLKWEMKMDSLRKIHPSMSVREYEMKERRTNFAMKLKQEKYSSDSTNRIKYDSLLNSVDILERTSLKFNNGHFEKPPNQLYNMDNLDSLDLSENAIKTIDKYLFSLPKLKKLILSHNDLGYKSISIRKNFNLESLDLSYNKLTKVPSRIHKLKQLKSLDLSNNQLERNGRKLRLKKWKSLENLNLSNNGLTKLPAGLHKLKNLKSLQLSNNKISSLKGLEKMKSLKELGLSRNIVALDPRYIVGLESLEILTMRNCGLISLPSEIGQLQSLKELVLPENKLVYLPDEIGELENLEILMVYKNQLIELPEELFDLKQLNWLDIYYNKIDQLSSKIASLKNLNILFLSHNQFDELPESLGSMDSLKELYIHHNKLRELPDISNLKKLKYLHLQHNHLTVFPSSVLELKQLEELDVSHNLITDFPEEVKNFRKLNFIYLNDNMTDMLDVNYEKLKVALKELNDRGVGINFDYPEEEE